MGIQNDQLGLLNPNFEVLGCQLDFGGHLGGVAIQKTMTHQPCPISFAKKEGSDVLGVYVRVGAQDQYRLPGF